MKDRTNQAEAPLPWAWAYDAERTEDGGYRSIFSITAADGKLVARVQTSDEAALIVDTVNRLGDY